MPWCAESCLILPKVLTEWRSTKQLHLGEHRTKLKGTVIKATQLIFPHHSGIKATVDRSSDGSGGTNIHKQNQVQDQFVEFIKHVLCDNKML